MDQKEQLIEDDSEEAANPARGALSLALAPARISIGQSKVSLNWRLTMTNTGDAHVVSLRIWSDLVSAHSSIPSDEQLGGPDMAHAQPQAIPLLAPGEKESLAGEWHLMRDEVRPVDNAPDRLILPLARFRLVGAGMLPFRMAFIIGNPPKPNDNRLRALQLDGGLKIHSRLAARAIW